MDTLTQCNEILDDIEVALANIATHLDEIASEIAHLEADGVFDQVPSESWETRNGGDTRYLRLVFPSTRGKRHKEYIGCNPVKIAAAQAKIERSERRKRLQIEQRRLHQRLGRARGDLRSAEANLVTIWPTR